MGRSTMASLPRFPGSGRLTTSPAAAPTTLERVRLGDGRWLAFERTGLEDATAAVCFYFHGFPGSRLEVRLAGVAAREAGIQLIGVDRPGFGCSDPHRGRALLDWPADVAELADAIGVARFALLGVSGGAPYAAAVARMLADRVTVAGIVNGLGPPDTVEGRAGLSGVNRAGLALATRAPFLIPVIAAGLRSVAAWRPQWLVARLRSAATGADRTALENEELSRLLSESFREAVRGGQAGLVSDARIYISGWAGWLEEITAPVLLWHGEEDRIVSPGMGRSVARAIPGCRAVFLTGDGHFSVLVNHLRTILTTIAAAHRRKLGVFGPAATPPPRMRL